MLIWLVARPVYRTAKAIKMNFLLAADCSEEKHACMHGDALTTHAQANTKVTVPLQRGCSPLCLEDAIKSNLLDATAGDHSYLFYFILTGDVMRYPASCCHRHHTLVRRGGWDVRMSVQHLQKEMPDKRSLLSHCEVKQEEICLVCFVMCQNVKLFLASAIG